MTSDRCTVMVTGANGFLGSHVCRMAVARGWRVRALLRGGSDRSLLQHGIPSSGFETVEGDFATDGTMPSAWFDGVAAIVHCAAATSEHTQDLAVSRAINVEATRRLATAAHAAGVGRFVFISSQSAHAANNSPYGRSKFEAEAALRSTPDRSVILRPGVIYGPERRGIFAKLEQNLRSLPVVPIIGNGRYLQYPVHVDDVATAALAVIEADQCVGRTYELGGAAPIAFRDLVRCLLAEMKLRKPLIFLPIPVCRLLATVLGVAMKNPPINHSNIEGLLTAPPLDNEPARRDFGYTPRSLEAGLVDVRNERAAAVAGAARQ